MLCLTCYYKVFALVEIFGTDLMVHRRYSKRSSQPKEKFTSILWYQNLVSFFYNNWAWKTHIKPYWLYDTWLSQFPNAGKFVFYLPVQARFHCQVHGFQCPLPSGGTQQDLNLICIKNAVKTMMLVNFSEWWNDQILPSGHHRQQCFFNETRNYLIQISVDCRPKHIFFSHSKQISYTC